MRRRNRKAYQIEQSCNQKILVKQGARKTKYLEELSRPFHQSRRPISLNLCCFCCRFFFCCSFPCPRLSRHRSRLFSSSSSTRAASQGFTKHTNDFPSRRKKRKKNTKQIAESSWTTPQGSSTTDLHVCTKIERRQNSSYRRLSPASSAPISLPKRSQRSTNSSNNRKKKKRGWVFPGPLPTHHFGYQPSYL